MRSNPGLVLGGVLVLLSDPLLIYYVTNTPDSDVLDLIQVLMFLGLIGGIVGLGITFLIFLADPKNKFASQTVGPLACICGLVGGSLWLGKLTWNEMMVRYTVNARPILGAIQAYTNEHKQPPTALQDLVPKYISSIPGTGMAGHPDYTYRRLDEGKNPWVLSVQMFSIGGWDELMYLPTGTYPGAQFGGDFERIGDWGYLHE